ncbi:hypothetical protein CANMA_004795 [Candida margitis]|uniref:uncharacterized protein n=1 Tax=Candida margitis TaxID=1775924 RepID=UPI002227CE91|nr:uncharacterized protein CANMA_004795 [Candida margitis]KAI5953956.1 hypothetical protein CANMA_004795 [Candida margitis]
MTKCTIASRSKNAEAPFSESQLLEIINENSKLTPQELASKLADKLTTISSKHKFLIHYTSLATNNANSFDMCLNTDFVSIWESSKDGCITVQLDLMNGSCDEEEAKAQDEDAVMKDDATTKISENSTNEGDATDGNSKEIDVSTPSEITSKTSPSQVNCLFITVYWISI